MESCSFIKNEFLKVILLLLQLITENAVVIGFINVITDCMEIKSESFIIENEAVWEELGGGVRRQIMAYDEHLMLVKVCFEKGAIGALHQHIHSQASYVASGVFEVNINGKKSVLKAGDSFYIIPNALHGVVCLEAGTLIDSFAPARADFLQAK